MRYFFVCIHANWLVHSQLTSNSGFYQWYFESNALSWFHCSSLGLSGLGSGMHFGSWRYPIISWWPRGCSLGVGLLFHLGLARNCALNWSMRNCWRNSWSWIAVENCFSSTCPACHSAGVNMVYSYWPNWFGSACRAGCKSLWRHLIRHALWPTRSDFWLSTSRQTEYHWQQTTQTLTLLRH